MCVETIESGNMTKDLAICIKGLKKLVAFAIFLIIDKFSFIRLYFPSENCPQLGFLLSCATLNFNNYQIKVLKVFEKVLNIKTKV